MRVYVFSLPKNLARAKKIHDFLELKGHSAKLFDSDSRFFNCVYKKEDLPDFIVYDYFLFNHNLFNIYTFMKGECCLIPLHITRKLSGTNLTIFKKLFNNLNSCVPMEELQHSEELDKNLKETTIFCTISKIRKTLKAVDEDSFEILKNSNGYTMISRY